MKKITKKAAVGPRIIERLNGFAQALENQEEIVARFTCRTIELDLKPTQYNPDLVKRTRALLGTSQAIFNRFLGLSVQTVRAWEQGVNTPTDLTARFLDEIRANPNYWRQRLQQVATAK